MSPQQALLTLLVVTTVSPIAIAQRDDGFAMAQLAQLSDDVGLETEDMQMAQLSADTLVDLVRFPKVGSDHGQMPPSGRGLSMMESSHESNDTSVDSSDWFFSRSPTLADVTPGIVRITTIDPMTDTTILYKPWAYTTDLDSEEAIGSGVIVAKDPIVIVTNTHVVKNAISVRIEFPTLGQQKYNADVRMISPDFDIALLTLTHESDVVRDAAKLGVTLPVVKFGDREPQCPLGASVLALGFSLGMNELKLSEGIISGSNSDDFFMCTSTAPISPGNSGGPLMYKDDMTIAGLNTASFVGEEAQNLNLIVPGFRVKQHLAKLDLANLSATGFPVVAAQLKPSEMQNLPERLLPHVQVRAPNTWLHTVPHSETLYEFFGCHGGVFVSHISSTSVYSKAKPALPPRFFFQSVNDHELDPFGLATLPKFASDPLDYTQLMFLGHDLTGDAKITICMDGNISEHTVPLRWQDSFETSFRKVIELAFAQWDFEAFAGFSVMELTLNHISDLVEQGALSYGRFLIPENQREPRLFISSVDAGSRAELILGTGMVVEKVNGRVVRTLQDFRDAFVPPPTSWKGSDAGEDVLFTLETDRAVVFPANFYEEVKDQIKAAKDGSTHLLTPAIRLASATRNLTKDEF